jgi:hypothetical protein
LRLELVQITIKAFAMANTKDSKYSRLEKGDEVLDVDLENDSDTTLASTGFLHAKGSGTKRPSRRRRIRKELLVWLRWSTIVVLQSIIMLLLFRKGTVKTIAVELPQAHTETGGDVNGLYIPSECRRDGGFGETCGS